MFHNFTVNLILLTFVLVFINFGGSYKIRGERRRYDKGSGSVIYCHWYTPCGWLIYNFIDYPDMDLRNNYCVCPPNQKCVIQEARIAEGVKEYRCKNKKRSALNQLPTM